MFKGKFGRANSAAGGWFEQIKVEYFISLNNKSKSK